MPTYAERTLTPPERFVCVNRRSAWPAFGRLLVLSAVGAVAIIIVTGESQAGFLLPFGVAFGLGLPVFLVHVVFLKRLSELSLTTRRVVIKRGLVFRRVNELTLDRVEGLQVDQSIPGRILGYGTLSFSGVGNMLAVVRGIRDPMGFRRRYMEVRQAADP